MKPMIVLFLLMTFYGIYAGETGGAMITCGMAAYVNWANKQFAKASKSRAADPTYAKSPRGTMNLLKQEQCECMACNVEPTT